jgi:uncharacterized protein
MLTRPTCFGAGAIVFISLGASSLWAQSSEDVLISNAGREVPATIVVPDGEGPFAAVVMNHGHGGGRQENSGFGGIAEAMAERGILSIRMDFPGTGDSTEPFTENFLSNMISDSNASLVYVLENHDVDPDRLGIMGYSMGGRIAMHIGGSDNNPYRAMALLAPSADWGKDMLVSFLGGEAEFERLHAEAVGEQGYAEFTTRWGQQQQLSRVFFEEMIESRPVDALEGYDGAMLVIFGDRDDVVRPGVGEAVVAAYPEAEMVIILDADHGYGFYSDQPEVTEQVESLIADFFAANLQ